MTGSRSRTLPSITPSNVRHKWAGVKEILQKCVNYHSINVCQTCGLPLHLSCSIQTNDRVAIKVINGERGPEPGAAKLLRVLPGRGCCGEPPSFSCLSTGAAFLAARLHAARQLGTRTRLPLRVLAPPRQHPQPTNEIPARCAVCVVTMLRRVTEQGPFA